MYNRPRVPQSVFRVADEALRLQVYDVQAAVLTDTSLGLAVPKELDVLARADRRYVHWPQAFERSRRIARVILSSSRDNWRVKFGMPGARLSPLLSGAAWDNTQTLIDSVAWSRVRETTVGTHEQPSTFEERYVGSEYTAVLRELRVPEQDQPDPSLVTWDSTVMALLRSEVCIGLAEEQSID